MNPRGYVIARRKNGAIQYLRLAGIFHYPEWLPELRGATTLFGANASAWLEAVDSKDYPARMFAAEGASMSSISDALKEAPDTDRNPPTTYGYGGIGFGY